MEETIQTEGSDQGVYELAFLLSPSITEEKLPEAFGALKAIIIDRGAVALAEEFPKNIPLAYTMEKTINHKIERFKEAWFGWIKFELSPEAVAALNAAFLLREDVVRHLLVSTVRENTIASKRAFGPRRRPKTPTKEGEEGAPEMTKEEIDAEIDALVSDKETV